MGCEAGDGYRINTYALLDTRDDGIYFRNPKTYFTFRHLSMMSHRRFWDMMSDHIEFNAIDVDWVKDHYICSVSYCETHGDIHIDVYNTTHKGMFVEKQLYIASQSKSTSTVYADKQSDPYKRIMYTYIMTDGVCYKIGQSYDPYSRLKNIKTGNIRIKMVHYGDNISEKSLHKLFQHKHVELEWYDLDENDVSSIKNMLCVYDHNGTVYHKYRFLFGRYKGCRLIDMVSDEQLQYCEWLVSHNDTQTKYNDENTEAYKAVSWWLDVNTTSDGVVQYYKEYYNEDY